MAACGSAATAGRAGRRSAAWRRRPTGTLAAAPRNSLVIGCLHVEFGANADADTVYAGTGEPVRLTIAERAIPGGKSGGIGILKLTRTVSAALADPAGNPWEREAPNLTGAGIFRIVRDPANADRLVAATTFGLFTRSRRLRAQRRLDARRLTAFQRAEHRPGLGHRRGVGAACDRASGGPCPALRRTGQSRQYRPCNSAVYVSDVGVGGAPFEKITLPSYSAAAAHRARRGDAALRLAKHSIRRSSTC